MNRQEFRKNRQATTKLLILFLATFLLSLQSCAQEKEKQTTRKDYLKNVDYTIHSNILNPDTLRGDQKKIFWHFVKLTHEEAENLTPFEIKAEFKKIGISIDDKKRFSNAWDFFDLSIVFHKKSCENFAYFDFLKPKSKN